MTAYLAGPLVAYDLESTGVNVESDRVVTACVARLMPGTPLWTQEISSHLIAVEVDIPEAATAVHGITTKFARDNGTDPTSTLDTIAGQLADAMAARIPVVGSNMAYDFTLLDRDLRRHDLPTLDERIGRAIGPVIDVYVMDKHLDPYRPGSRKLVDLCTHYGVSIVGAHDSTGDALAAARVAYRIGMLARKTRGELMARYGERRRPGDVADAFLELAGMSLAELHQAQAGWRREQQLSLADYLRRKGESADDVDPSWPCRPYVTTTEAKEAW